MSDFLRLCFGTRGGRLQDEPDSDRNVLRSSLLGDVSRFTNSLPPFNILASVSSILLCISAASWILLATQGWLVLGAKKLSVALADILGLGMRDTNDLRTVEGGDGDVVVNG